MGRKNKRFVETYGGDNSSFESKVRRASLGELLAIRDGIADLARRTGSAIADTMLGTISDAIRQRGL